MTLLKKIKKADVFWRKMAAVAILIVLAVPLLFLVAHNARSRMTKGKPFNLSNAPKLEQGLQGILEGISFSTTSQATSSQ